MSTKTGECQEIQMGCITFEKFCSIGKHHIIVKNSAVSSFLEYCSLANAMQCFIAIV